MYALVEVVLARAAALANCGRRIRLAIYNISDTLCKTHTTTYNCHADRPAVVLTDGLEEITAVAVEQASEEGRARHNVEPLQ